METDLQNSFTADSNKNLYVCYEGLCLHLNRIDALLCEILKDQINCQVIPEKLVYFSRVQNMYGIK